MAEIKKVEVEIFGETFTLKTDGDPARVLETAALVDNRMRQLAQTNPRMTPAKAAVLTALCLADEYLRLDRDYQEIIRMLRDQK